MDTMNRINVTFENVRNAVKTKKSSELLRHLKKDIHTLSYELLSLGKENTHQFVRSLAMEGYLALLSAKTMPIPTIEKRDLLQVAYDKLKPFALRDECLYIFLRIQNLLCYYLIQLEQITIAQNILDNTENLYDEIGKNQDGTYFDAEDLFSAQPIENLKRVKVEKIDKIITNNIQMQAFLYNKQNCQDKYTIYSHTVLRRQLEMKEGTPRDWAMRAARLGNYFTCINRMGNARHHLCAAYFVLKTCHENCKLVPEEFIIQKGEFEMNFLELSHYWVKYGLTLFKLSKKQILSKCFSQTKADLWKTVESIDNTAEEITNTLNLEDEDTNKNEIMEKNATGDFNTESIFKFPSLDLTLIESETPCECVNKLNEARKLFSFTRKWLLRAKHYYDIEHYAAQYISCSLQLTELYEHLIFFEPNIDNQYNLQKRRAEVLENLTSLLKSLNSLTSVQIDVIRELSQVQLEMMALNLQKLWREESSTNVFNPENDTESFYNSLESASNKTLTEKTLNMASKNIFLKKMEAMTSINGRLSRLSGHLNPETPSMVSLDTLH